MPIIQNRRTFLAGLSAAGALGPLKSRSSSAAAESPPETTTIRLPRWNDNDYCWAALYVAGELLRAEGFTDVRYVRGKSMADNSDWIAQGETDFDVNMGSMHLKSIDTGVPIKVLTGVHLGCFELIGNESIASITDLRGKRVGVWALNSHPHVLVTLIAAYVGLDPVNEINWVETDDKSPMQLFIDGKVDAFLAGPPEPLLIREQKIGHTILSNGVDRPWSQYYCCMVAGRTDYVTRYPAATKRFLRSILKGADLCASDPQSVARQLVDRGLLADYEYALVTLKEIQHDRWRDFDAEDSLRFYALRMQETGLIKSSPQQIIADGTDWRFLHELKRELKT